MDKNFPRGTYPKQEKCQAKSRIFGKDICAENMKRQKLAKQNQKTRKHQSYSSFPALCLFHLHCRCEKFVKLRFQKKSTCSVCLFN